MHKMLKLVSRTAFIGIGLAVMSAATINKLGRQMAKDAKLSEKEGKKFVDDLVEQSKKSKAELKETIQKSINESLSEMHILKTDDLSEITKRLDDIESSLEANGVSKPKSKGRPSKSTSNSKS